MAVITVPKNIAESGRIQVRESPGHVEAAIEGARRARRQIIVLTHARNGEELRIRWSLIQAIEEEGR